MRKWATYAEQHRSKCAEGVMHILQDRGRLPALDALQFNASGYPSAQPVSDKGGRGGAWFVACAAGPAVLKHYLRGGRAALVSRDSYVYLGEGRARSFAEFRLLKQLRSRDLPVPAPLAAFCLRKHWHYRAALLTERIAGARSFLELVRQGDAPWQQAGQTLARFHLAGAQHSDLNANNVLIDAASQVHLIDWDKGRLHQGPGPWCAGVLARLQRSLKKELGAQYAQLSDRGWTTLETAYKGAIPWHG